MVTLVLKGIGILVAVWIGWAVIKGVWNVIFSGGGSEVITEAAIMEKWQEHLEKRRDAFDDGLPEKEIEAKGLKNYTWDEWQEKVFSGSTAGNCASGRRSSRRSVKRRINPKRKRKR